MAKVQHTVTGCVPVDKSALEAYAALNTKNQEVSAAEDDRQEAEGQGDYSDTTLYPNTRRAKEAARQAAETERIQNEGSGGPSSAGYSTSRIKMEIDRQNAETQRQTNEGVGETDAECAVGSRRKNESIRQANEETRQANEETRQAQEGTPNDEASVTGSRWARYKKAEADRNTSYGNEEGESTDEASESGSRWARFNKAQGDRTTAYNTAETARNTAIAPLVGCYECATAASTAAKVVSATSYILTSGGSVKVKFTYANTASSPTLNINSTGAKTIVYNGAVASSSNTWASGDVVEFYYDPTYNSNAGAFVGIPTVVSVSQNTLTTDNKAKAINVGGTDYNITDQDAQDKISQLGQEVNSVIKKATIDVGEKKTGYFYDYMGELQSDVNSAYYDPIDISEYAGFVSLTILLTRILKDTSSSGRSIVLTDENGVVLSYIKEKNFEVISENRRRCVFEQIPANAKYLKISFDNYRNDVVYSCFAANLLNQENINQLRNDLASLADSTEEEINGIVNGYSINILPVLGEKKSNYYYGYASVGTVIAKEYNPGSYYYEPVNLSQYVGKKLIITNNTSYTSSVRSTALCNADGIIGSIVSEKQIRLNGGTWEMEILDGYSYLYVSIDSESIITLGVAVPGTNETFNEISEQINELGTESIFISPNGNDTNKGEYNSPMATINEALKKGASKIIMFGGVYNLPKIDLSLCTKSSLEIASYSYQDNVVIKPLITDYMVCNGGEVLVTGKTKVYQCASQNSVIDASLDTVIYQENINDASTLISEVERHPLQRGREYRCENTKIIKCSANNVSDAVDEIENSQGYKWYLDTVNGILYYSRPTIVSNSYPIVAPKREETLLIPGYQNRNVSFKMVAINVMYKSINISDFINPVLIGCSAKYVNRPGCFEWDKSQGAHIEKCEGASAYYGTNGDGFNSGISNTSGLDPYSCKNSATLIDCWSHDNADDGYSSHALCETIIIGGLFEYNTKGGLTPAYGDKIECYNVISRRNHRGFYLAGTVQDGHGKYDQCLFMGCVARDNIVAGFSVEGFNNKLIAISCKSINNPVGYNAGTDATMDITDCGSLNDTLVKSGAGTFVIINTSAVTEN